jgi:hypothetical protein
LYCFPLLASTIAHKDKLQGKEKLKIHVPWFVNFDSKNIDVKRLQVHEFFGGRKKLRKCQGLNTRNSKHGQEYNKMVMEED